MKRSAKKTGNKFLLDTSVIVEIFKGDMGIADKVNSLGEFAVCTIVLGELRTGINRVANKQKHLKMLDGFLELCEVMVVDSDTAGHYGSIMAALHRKGRPIPTNDVWIAACAARYGCTVVTTDKHFQEIDGIKVQKW